MKVLYVVSLFPCWSETFIVREVRALLGRGVDVRILSLRRPSERLVHEDARALLDRVLYPPRGSGAPLAVMRRLARRPAAHFALLVRLARALARRPVELAKSLAAVWRTLAVAGEVEAMAPDAVHAHWATYPATAALVLHRTLGLPFSFTAHAHDLFLHDHLLREKLSAARFAVTVAESNRRWVADRVGAAAAERLQIVRCGVPLDEFPFQPGRRTPRLILAVGRLDEIKGLAVLVDACAALRRRGRDVACDIVGEGGQRRALEARISALGLRDVVRLRGALPQQEVRTLLYRASVFALPCVVASGGNRDGIPVALLEAMAAGLPVVTTGVSGIPEAVHDGHDGLLAAPGDSDGLAGQLERLLDDARLRIRLSANARRTVERTFNAETESEKLLALFERGRRPGGAAAGDEARGGRGRMSAAVNA